MTESCWTGDHEPYAGDQQCCADCPDVSDYLHACRANAQEVPDVQLDPDPTS